MPTPEQILACISGLDELRRKSRLLPHGIVAARLCVSRQRLDELIRRGVVETDSVDGGRLVVVASALSYAKARYQRTRKQSRNPA